MRHDYYILEGKTARPVDMMTWAQWFETGDRQIAETRHGTVRVSTIFLGLNNSRQDYEPPLLFETMCFGGEFDGEIMRYSTYEEAEAGHALMCDKALCDDSILDAEEISPILEAEIIF